MFTGRSAAEIVASDKDFCVTVLRFVQHEIRDLVAVVVVPHFVEQIHAKTRPLDRLEELLGDDHVGVDVHQRHRSRDPGEFFEFVHYIISRTSVSFPVIAAAAAIAGDIRCVRPPRP